jgi:hypothetical protein
MTELEHWLVTRPIEIQQLAARFPPGTFLDSYGWVVGYAEMEDGHGLYVSQISPYEDYDRAVEVKEFLCADHFMV